MTDPHALLDAYATEKDWEYPMAFKPSRALFAPAAFAALRAVLELCDKAPANRRGVMLAADEVYAAITGALTSGDPA